MAYIQTANRTIERSPHVAAIGEINRLVKRAFDVAGRERARRVVETAVGTRTYSKVKRRTANRTIERSPNVPAIGADYRN